jgi:phosphate-selective porin
MNKREVTSIIAAVVCSLIFGASAWAEETPAPEAAPSEPKVSDIVGYDKGFYIMSPDKRFKMTMGGYIQGLFSAAFIDDAGDTDTFRVRRARLKWFGHLYSEDIQYQLEYDFTGSDPSGKLLSTYLQLVHSPAFKARVGQWKVPFNLEGMSSGSTLQFVDRSIAHAFFGIIPDERETGFGFNGELMDKKIEYELSAFNGEGINTLNENNEFRYIGRFTYNLMGHHGLEFSDTKQSETPNVALAVAAFYNDTPDAAGTDEEKITSLATEVAAKYKGFGGYGAFYYKHTDPDAATSADDTGFLVQGGYFFIPKIFEAGLRFAQVYPDGGSTRAEYTLGMNYYIHDGHRVKFQFDYGALMTEDGVVAGDDRLDHLVRAQLQVKI